MRRISPYLGYMVRVPHPDHNYVYLSDYGIDGRRTWTDDICRAQLFVSLRDAERNAKLWGGEVRGAMRTSDGGRTALEVPPSPKRRNEEKIRAAKSKTSSFQNPKVDVSKNLTSFDPGNDDHRVILESAAEESNNRIGGCNGVIELMASAGIEIDQNQAYDAMVYAMSVQQTGISGHFI